MSARDATRTRAALAVEGRMFPALAVIRVVVLAYAVGSNVYRDNFERPGAGWACVALMVVATPALIAAYAAPQRRTPALLLVDLALALGLLLATPYVKGEGFQASVPGYWIIGAVLAWAVRHGWRGGLGAGAAVGAVDLLTRAEPAQKDLGNVFLLVLCGSMVGFLCDSLIRMAGERDAAQHEAAAAAERARLARAVHDGVLQVLALVQRRGAELGGDAAELGRLAGEQEQALRNLIRTQSGTVGDAVGAPREVDLAGALAALGGAHVEVAVPGGGVPLPAHTAEEVVAVVRACLDNVRRHVGEDAPAWVLLEDLDAEVVVSVRDAGPGIAPGRLEEAEQQGRLGVSGSIRGRVADLGGTAELDSSSYGTEWTITVPSHAAPSAP